MVSNLFLREVKEMKKLTALFLVFVLVFAFAACGDNDTTSTPDASSQASTDASNPASAEASDDESSVDDTSDVNSEETSEPAPELPDYIDGFVYVAGEKYDMKPTDSSAIRLTKINETPGYGDVVCFTPDYGSTIQADDQTYEDFAILVVEYVKDKFNYYKKQIIPVDDTTTDKAAIEIPEDGYVVAIHEAQEMGLAALEKVKDDVIIYPSNFNPYDYSYNVLRVETPFEINGVIGAEWDPYLVDEIDETNPSWDYSQFDKNDYGITANYFLAYSDAGVYIGVKVNTAACVWLPNISVGTAQDMWKKTCIQVNVLDQSPLSDYMLKNAQMGSTGTWGALAIREDHMRQYGFSGSDSGESYVYAFMAGSHALVNEEAKYACIFNEAEETITYEVFLPWEEINVDPEEVVKGFEFSVSVSINSTTSTESDAKWANIRARNGGGIIGMNELTKMPVCKII